LKTKYNKEYYENHKDLLKEQVREYRTQQNADNIKERQREYQRNRHICPVCGNTYGGGLKLRHERSETHLKALEGQSKEE